MKARLGKAEGITATAHRIARIIYNLVAKQVAYDDSLILSDSPQAAAHRRAHLSSQARKLGFKLVPIA